MTELSLRTVDPDGDAPMIHSWVTEERAKYWGMGDHTRKQVQEVYQFLDGLTTHHAYIVLWGDKPVALFQTYEPSADPVGDYYDVQPGDFGIHLMIAPSDETAHGFTSVIFDYLADHVFSDPAHQRVVVEPDARNARAISRFCSFGFEEGAEIELPEKPARLGFLTREQYESTHATG